jgi:hypothetical protein
MALPPPALSPPLDWSPPPPLAAPAVLALVPPSVEVVPELEPPELEPAATLVELPATFGEPALVELPSAPTLALSSLGLEQAPRAPASAQAHHTWDRRP